MKTLTTGLLALVALGLSAPAFSATLTCPDENATLVPVGIDIERTVTIVYDDGYGNWACGPAGRTSGQDGTNEGNYFAGEGLIQLDKIDDGDAGQSNGTNTGLYITSISGLGETSGSFEIAGGLEDITFVFKFGSDEPDWISFVWTGSTGGGLTGNWVVQMTEPNAANNALSHVTLYGEVAENGEPPAEIPEPATLMLLGMGLLGLAALRRRRMI